MVWESVHTSKWHLSFSMWDLLENLDHTLNKVKDKGEVINGQDKWAQSTVSILRMREKVGICDVREWGKRASSLASKLITPCPSDVLATAHASFLQFPLFCVLTFSNYSSSFNEPSQAQVFVCPPTPSLRLGEILSKKGIKYTIKNKIEFLNLYSMSIIKMWEPHIYLLY